MQVGERAPVFAIADEDLERTAEDKTSAVHFLRFELTPEMVAMVKEGAPVSVRGRPPALHTRARPCAVRGAVVLDERPGLIVTL